MMSLAGEALRVLYVEDEDDIRLLGEMALADVGGFQVRACASGAEAIAAARDFQPDLLVLDVMMPEMDGPSTLKALRALPQTAAVPAVFMTAKIMPNEIEALKKLGALEVVPKPFDPMTIAETLRAIWRRGRG
jgi:CheY-like chemotaxis protein